MQTKTEAIETELTRNDERHAELLAAIRDVRDQMFVQGGILVRLQHRDRTADGEVLALRDSGSHAPGAPGRAPRTARRGVTCSGAYRRAWTGADGRVRWVASYRDQEGKRRNKGFLTRKEAKGFLVLTEGEVIRGIHTPESTSITVAEAARLWLQHGEPEGLERSTLRQYRNHVDRHILPLIGAVKLARLSTPVVQTFRDELLEAILPSDGRKVLASLK